MATDPPAVETHKFQAEVTQVLHLVVNSLYSHKEVFLRELISNASDALDKLKFRAITEPALLGDDGALEIRILPDPAAGTLTIEDTGAGMTHDELVENLGTIAHSGSRKFLEALRQKGDAPGVSLIGQFGVGFYSAYLVADRVTVVSRAAGTDQAWRWVSDAQEAFTVEPAERSLRGTAVVLHLKDDQKEFLQAWRLRDLVGRYSDFVSHPILLPRETPAADDEDDKTDAKPGDEPGDEPDGKTPAPALETVNRASALWQRPKSEVTREQYEELYKHLTREEEAPLAWTHFRVEGSQEFTGLLFVPRTAPFDLDTPGEVRRGVRLFVKRVFIMDNCEAIVPPWLRFIRGVIDSDDLPLNVSRETLQDSAVVRAIRKQVIRKSLDLLDELARDRADDYKLFWQQFGRVLKEGLHNEWEYRERFAPLVRYESSRDEGLTSLAEYVARMPEGQAAIYYALGESRRAVAESPHLEALRSRGYEVLYMTDLVDQWAAEALREFQGKKLVSAMKADLPLPGGPGDEAAKKVREEQAGALKPLLGRVQAVLGERVREVRVSDRLTDSPCCLVVPEGGLNPALERILKAHGRDVPTVKRILEVNPKHPLVVALEGIIEREPDAPRLPDWIEMLYEQALLTEGTPIEDPQRFARRLTSLLEQAVTAASPGTPPATPPTPAAP